jgi:hypothetical protein
MEWPSLIAGGVITFAGAAFGAWLQFYYQQRAVKDERRKERKAERQHIRARYNAEVNGLKSATDVFYIHRHLTVLREMMLQHEDVLLRTQDNIEYFNAHLAPLPITPGKVDLLHKAQQAAILLTLNKSKGEAAMENDLKRL